MTKPKEKLTIIFLAILLFSLLSLTGCKDSEKEKAVAEAAAAKAKLAGVKADLTKITSERDNLKSELAAVIEARDKLQAATDQAIDVKEQLTELAKERDIAIAKVTDAQTMVDKLKGQLQEQIQKSLGLEGQNKKLQEMIDELQKKLGSEVGIPSIPKL